MTDTYRLNEPDQRPTDPVRPWFATREPDTSSPPRSPQTRTAAAAEARPAPRRLASLDAYRGFIMTMLAASGFGIAKMAELPPESPAWSTLNYELFQSLKPQFTHPEWNSRFGLMGVAFWDLIQPAFMFMVGVAVPFSVLRRQTLGQPALPRFFHALWRSLILILMGVFLSSMNAAQTNWVFPNVLCQIGLGYMAVYVLAGTRPRTQAIAIACILVGYWYYFQRYERPEDYYEQNPVAATDESIYEGKFAPWSKNANAGHDFDVWLLNRFPRAEGDVYEFNKGGYLTLNFIPSIATMLLGSICGQLLMSSRSSRYKLQSLIAGGAVCMVLGLLAGEFACPIVKRIWTPSWALFSGAYVIWILALFYLLFDVLPLRWLALPWIVVGMNSIAMYLMGQLMRPWTQGIVQTHFGQAIERLFGIGSMADDMYGRMLNPAAAFLVFWLIAFWMYRNRYIVRI